MAIRRLQPPQRPGWCSSRMERMRRLTAVRLITQTRKRMVSRSLRTTTSSRLMTRTRSSRRCKASSRTTTRLSRGMATRGMATSPPAYPGDGGPGRQQLYNGQQAPPPPTDGPYAGQHAGMSVTIPAGVPLQVRLNRGFNSNNVQVGTPFTATVMYDVVAGGAIAIPRGATVSGTVIEAKRRRRLQGAGSARTANHGPDSGRAAISSDHCGMGRSRS